jgi:L-asparaginase
MDARTVQKVHATALDAFADISNSGVILSRDEKKSGASQPALSSQLQSQPALSSRTPFRDQFLEPTFDISSLHSLPKVSVLYFNADADAELVRFAAERSAGLVIAGAGAGEFSKSWALAIANVIADKNIPVVISTRINCGSIVPEQLLVSGTIASYGLPPAKAAVLLRLALTVTNDSAAIQDMFSSLLPMST